MKKNKIHLGSSVTIRYKGHKKSNEKKKKIIKKITDSCKHTSKKEASSKKRKLNELQKIPVENFDFK